jgi:hypothetical protein
MTSAQIPQILPSLPSGGCEKACEVLPFIVLGLQASTHGEMVLSSSHICLSSMQYFCFHPQMQHAKNPKHGLEEWLKQ